jgi:hypothetical protein
MKASRRAGIVESMDGAGRNNRGRFVLLLGSSSVAALLIGGGGPAEVEDVK